MVEHIFAHPPQIMAVLVDIQMVKNPFTDVV